MVNSILDAIGIQNNKIINERSKMFFDVISKERDKDYYLLSYILSCHIIYIINTIINFCSLVKNEIDS